MYRHLGTIIETWHNSLWYKTIVFYDMKNVTSLGTCSEIQFAVKSYILFSPVLIGMAYNEHL